MILSVVILYCAGLGSGLLFAHVVADGDLDALSCECLCEFRALCGGGREEEGWSVDAAVGERQLRYAYLSCLGIGVAREWGGELAHHTIQGQC